jgi:hypothetical protein
MYYRLGARQKKNSSKIRLLLEAEAQGAFNKRALLLLV